MGRVTLAALNRLPTEGFVMHGTSLAFAVADHETTAEGLFSMLSPLKPQLTLAEVEAAIAAHPHPSDAPQPERPAR